MHHPWTLGVAAWWTLSAIVLKLDTGQLIVGLLPTLAIIVNFYFSKRQRDTTNKKVDVVHELVNAQHTAQENRIAQLEETIQSSDKELPPTTRETGTAR